MHLSRIIADVERGCFPPPDSGLTVVPAPSPGRAAVLAFTAHTVVAADVEPAWVDGLVPAGNLSASLCPPFLTALSERLGLRVNNIDLVCLATPLQSGEPVRTLRETPARNHPRVLRSLDYRHGVDVWETEGGLVSIGRGVAGRYEVTIEVEEGRRGHGLGRTLAHAARALVPAGRPLWAQIAPGNAASVRAFLDAGYRPVGAEALLVP